jgi:hypothetical protein
MRTHQRSGMANITDITPITPRTQKIGPGGSKAQTLSPTATIASATTLRLVLLLRAWRRIRWSA